MALDYKLTFEMVSRVVHLLQSLRVEERDRDKECIENLKAAEKMRVVFEGLRKSLHVARIPVKSCQQGV
jgi:hypothetical protein